MPGDSQLRTVFFSDQLVGNSRGTVINSPFQNWAIPGGGTLRRNAGQEGTSLMRPSVVDAIMTDQSIMRHTQIVVMGQGFPDPDANGLPWWQRRNTNLESEHDNPHAWVGEILGNVDGAPQDPVFWFHHTFIDYIWEGFRMKMRDAGMDPQTDYPNFWWARQHGPDTEMAGMPGFVSTDGYLDEHARPYMPHPMCENSCYNSRFLYCPDGGSGTDRCVSNEISADAAPVAEVQAFAPEAADTMMEMAPPAPRMAAAFAAPMGARTMMTASFMGMGPARAITPIETTDTVAIRRAEAEGRFVFRGPNFRPTFADPRLANQ